LNFQGKDTSFVSAKEKIRAERVTTIAELNVGIGIL